MKNSKGIILEIMIDFIIINMINTKAIQNNIQKTILKK